MKKVLYLFDALKTGGAETSTFEIILRFKEWEAVVVSIYPGTDLKQRFEDAGIKVYSLNEKNRFAFPKILKELRNIIEKENPDLIHSNLFMADQFSRYLGNKINIPVINSFINDSYAPERYELLNFKQKLSLNLYKLFDRLQAKKVTRFMSITRAIVTNNTKALGIKPEKVEIIHRGRNIKAFRERVDSQKVQQLKARYNKGPIILTVSRLLIRKGYIEAIKAIKKVVSDFPDLTYLIAGVGHDREKFENLIDELGLHKNIVLLGRREDIPTLLEVADIFLFPSHYEGQGGALIEAMLMGKKIVATRIPVLQESVQHDYSARLFSYRDIDDLALQLRWALANPEKMLQLAENAKKEAEVNFDIEKIAHAHEAMYNEVISNYTK